MSSRTIKKFIKAQRSLLVLVAFFWLTPALFVWADAGSLEKAVTLSGLPQAWRMEDPLKTYATEDLFTYINGEAELYFPYGFKKLVSAYYNKTGSEPPIGLSVDVYEMGSLLDAFGIYAQYRKPEAAVLTLGGEGFVNPSQLMFYQDRYFIHISASGTAELDRSLFESAGGMISKNLPNPSASPKELGLVKISSLIPRTERYYPEGLLGYRFFSHGLIALARQGEKKIRFFVIPSASPEAAQKTVEQYLSYIAEGGVKPEKQEGGLLYARDPLHKGLLLAQKDRYVVGVVDLTSPDQGTSLIRELLAGLP